MTKRDFRLSLKKRILDKAEEELKRDPSSIISKMILQYFEIEKEEIIEELEGSYTENSVKNKITFGCAPILEQSYLIIKEENESL